MVCGAGMFEKADVLLCRSGRHGASRRSRTGGQPVALEVPAVDVVNPRFIFFGFLMGDEHLDSAPLIWPTRLLFQFELGL
jgi:hypothetical protein